MNSLATRVRRALVHASSPMPAWPKSILTFGATLSTARMAMRLRGRDSGVGPQRAALRELTAKLAATAYWREAGVEAGMSYENFRARVAPRTYETLQPAIERMQRGEADVLWPGACTLFASTAGTSTGSPRILPVSDALLAHFRTGSRDALYHYTARTGHAGALRGRHLFLSGSTALTSLSAGPGQRAHVGEWPAILALNVARSIERHLYEPGAKIADLTDWNAKVDAIIGRVCSADVSLLIGMPPWLLAFAEVVRERRMREGHPIENLAALWPNLEGVVHGGAAIAPYHPELRAVIGPSVAFHEVFAATEGVLAAQDTSAGGELRLMTNLGLFLEFVPLDDFDAGRPENLGEKAVPLEGVQPGVNYAILLTNPSGLARYVLGDVVRFLSTAPPRILWVGRTGLQLAAFGGRIIEKEVTEALCAVCVRHRWSPVNFHVAPLFGTNLTQTGGRHEWWIELKPGTVETPTGPQMAIELDAELQRLNHDYAARRASGRIDAPTVRLVMPGVFRHWMRFHGKWGGQNRVARCRSDRLIADELAQITRFARDQA